MKKTALLKKIILAATAALCIAVPASADYNRYAVPDSAEIRRAIIDTWLTAPLGDIRNHNIELRKNDIGTKFQIRLQEGIDEFQIIVSPQSFLKVDAITGTSHVVEQMEVYPEGAPGSWVLYRNKTNGKPTRICWYFNQDAEVYVQFRPEETKVLADMVVFGSFAARSVPVGIPFEKLFTMSFENVHEMTAKSLPWQKVNVVPKIYHAPLQMAAVIRENISRIDYADDACYNEGGKLYAISTGKPLVIKAEDDDEQYDDVVGNPSDDMEPLSATDSDDSFVETTAEEPQKSRLTLSNAGFIKWIIDGLIEPKIGSGTKIGELLEPTVDYNPIGKNGVLSQKWNLSFTLDWTRNLAAKELSARSSRMYTYKNGGVDVTVEPFAAELVNGQMVNAAGYVLNSGYSAKRLKSILYILAVSEPSYCYLAAIRQQSKLSRDEMVFNECAILFPYFDDTGRFGCIVFENGRESTLENFCGKYTDAFVHLERVKAEDAFFPQ